METKYDSKFRENEYPLKTLCMPLALRYFPVQCIRQDLALLVSGSHVHLSIFLLAAEFFLQKAVDILIESLELHTLLPV